MPACKIDESDVKLGKRIREAQKRSPYTKAEIALKIGVSYAQYNRYEMGLNRVSAKKLHLIANITDRPLRWFFHDDINETIADLLEQSKNGILTTMGKEELRSFVVKFREIETPYIKRKMAQILEGEGVQ